MVRPARKLKPGERLVAGDGTPVSRSEPERRRATRSRWSSLGEGEPLDLLATYGVMPLPPYIHTTLDRPERYQTVYANEPGSAAAPTAGLHLTPRCSTVYVGAASGSPPSSSSSASTRSLP